MAEGTAQERARPPTAAEADAIAREIRTWASLRTYPPLDLAEAWGRILRAVQAYGTAVRQDGRAAGLAAGIAQGVREERARCASLLRGSLPVGMNALDATLWRDALDALAEEIGAHTPEGAHGTGA